MDQIVIRGGQRLKGRIPISGAKNAALTLLPCALLTDEPLTLRNLPRLADVDGFGHLLNQLGCSTTIEGSRPEDFGRVMTARATTLTSTVAPYDIVRKMRASILVLGPLLAILLMILSVAGFIFMSKGEQDAKAQFDGDAGYAPPA